VRGCGREGDLVFRIVIGRNGQVDGNSLRRGKPVPVRKPSRKGPFKVAVPALRVQCRTVEWRPEASEVAKRRPRGRGWV